LTNIQSSNYEKDRNTFLSYFNRFWIDGTNKCSNLFGLVFHRRSLGNPNAVLLKANEK
jgi:uncharacterized membrane protein